MTVQWSESGGLSVMALPLSQRSAYCDHVHASAHFCAPSFCTSQMLNAGVAAQPVIDASENVCAPSGQWHVPAVWLHAATTLAIARNTAQRIHPIISRHSA